jgi:thiol-disulfide isomerase/thioredoxin
LVLTAVVGLIGGCGQGESNGNGGDGTATGGTAADSSGAVSSVSASDLPTIDAAGLQNVIDEAAAKDQVVVIDFWATWCAPCIEMFDPIHKGVAGIENAKHVTVTFDGPDEGRQKAAEFLHKHDALNENAYFAPPEEQGKMVDQLGQQWQNIVVPAVLVFDKNGNLAGEFLSAGVADAVVKKAAQLAGDSPAPATQPTTANRSEAAEGSTAEASM